MLVPANVAVPVPTETAVPAEGQPAAPETPAKAPEQLSKSFAALAKKEKALFRERESLKAQHAAIEAEKSRIAAIEAKYSKRPASPREALEMAGFSYRDATDFELNDGTPTAEQIARQAQQEVQKFRDEQAARDRDDAQKAVQKAEEERAQVVNEFKTEIQEFVAEKADDYELIKFNDAYEVVFNTVEVHYQKTGRLLSIPEAANIVEKFLEKRSDELWATKKFAKKREGTPQETPEGGFRSQTQVTAPQRTLNNAITASTPTIMKSPQVESDRIKRALAALDRR